MRYTADGDRDSRERLVELRRPATDRELGVEHADGGQARQARHRPQRTILIDQIGIDLTSAEGLADR